MYSELKSRIITDIQGQYFCIERGVRQGDPLSPILFNCLLEEIFRSIEWEESGVDINGERLNNLRFADNIILITNDFTQLEKMLSELIEKGEEAGLEINLSKTVLISNVTEIPELKVREQSVKRAQEAVYLGQIISFEDKMGKELDRRISIGWTKFWSLKHILKGNLNIRLKSRIFNACIIPALTYGAQTWNLTLLQEDKLRVAQNNMERAILKIKLKDRIPITTIKFRLRGNLNLLRVIRRQKWDWAGHVARMSNERWAYKLTFWQIYQKRRKGKPKRNWQDDINKFLRHKTFHRIAWDRSEWNRLREAYAQKQGLVR
jgi:hypothetical protein